MAENHFSTPDVVSISSLRFHVPGVRDRGGLFAQARREECNSDLIIYTSGNKLCE